GHAVVAGDVVHHRAGAVFLQADGVERVAGLADVGAVEGLVGLAAEVLVVRVVAAIAVAAAIVIAAVVAVLVVAVVVAAAVSAAATGEGTGRKSKAGDRRGRDQFGAERCHGKSPQSERLSWFVADDAARSTRSLTAN